MNKHYMTHYNSIAVFLFPAIALAFPSGYSYGAVLLLLGSLTLLWKRPASFSFRKDDFLVMGAFFLYFLTYVLLNILHQDSGSSYDAPSRFLLILAVFLVLRAYVPNPAALWCGVGIGGIVAGIVGIWQVFGLGLERATGYNNPIQFGNAGILLGFFCIAGLPWALARPHRGKWLALLGTGFIAGILAAMLTSSRGSWLAIPACLLVVAIGMRSMLPKRTLTMGISAILVAATVAYAVPQTGIRERVALIPAEIAQYKENNNSSTSVGARIEMLRLGLILVPQQPWTGWGYKGFRAENKRMAEAGEIGTDTTIHSHLHNEYLDATAKRGIVGLLATLFLFLAPLVFFARKVCQHNTRTLPYALAGTLLYASYIVFSLTQAFLTHNDGVLYLTFFTAILWSLIRHHEQDTD